MTTDLKEYDVVLLLETTSALHFITGKPIVLPRGCMGTIVDDTIGEFALVEFADYDGCAYAITALRVDSLVKVIHEPLEITA